MRSNSKECATPERLALRQRLNHERVERHWTQAELAKRACLPSHVVTNLEAGHTMSPSADAILRLSKVLNLRPEWLLDGAGEKYVPGPVEIPDVAPVTIERVPLGLAKTLLKVVEEMQYSRLFCEENLGVKHIERWLGLLLAQPELRSIGDHFMRAALENDPALPGSSPTLVVNNVGVLPERVVESGVVLPKPENQPAVVQKTAKLVAPPADREPAPANESEFADLGNVVTSLDPLKGTKLKPIKKGSYLEVQLRKRMPPRKDGILRQGDVCALLGISPPTFWLWQQNDADFPKAIEFDNNGKATGYARKDFEYYLRLKLMEKKTKLSGKVAHA